MSKNNIEIERYCQHGGLHASGLCNGRFWHAMLTGPRNGGAAHWRVRDGNRGDLAYSLTRGEKCAIGKALWRYDPNKPKVSA